MAITVEGYIDRYETYARKWIKKHGDKYRSPRPASEAEATLYRYMASKIKIDMHKESMLILDSPAVISRATVTAAAGLIPFGKIIVGGAANLSFPNEVLVHFALDKQPDLDKLKAELIELTGVKNVPRDIKVEYFEHTITNAIEEGMGQAAEEGVHMLPLIGHAFSVGSGAWRSLAACRSAVERVAPEAERIHLELFWPIALSRKSKQGSIRDTLEANSLLPPPIRVYRIPSCAACFLGPYDGNRERFCKWCLYETGPKIGAAERGVSDCCKKDPYVKNSTTFHSKKWCSKTLVDNYLKEAAWGCIPCFLEYGKHKPANCAFSNDSCSYCGFKGHHMSGCGQRFFQGLWWLHQAQMENIELQAYITKGHLAVPEKRTSQVRWDTNEFANHGRLKYLNVKYQKLTMDVALLGPNFKPARGGTLRGTSVREEMMIWRPNGPDAKKAWYLSLKKKINETDKDYMAK